MGVRLFSIKLFVFITIFAVLLQDYQAECRGGGRGGGGRGGGGRGGGGRGYKYKGGRVGATGSGGLGADSWWMGYAMLGLLVIGGIVYLIIVWCRR